MERIQFQITIDTPAEKVADIMLGISDKSTYEQWTTAFDPTSSYDGMWSKGSKIRFIGTDEKGEIGGMISEIVEHIPNQFVSIRHYGLLKANIEITEGPEVEKWANGFENYTFEENNGVTTVTVDVDTSTDFVAYMNTTFPTALDRLKELCEN
ncbi:MAG: SRPBCC domain-containing protein [Crocinitomicaceae bacterium]|nr:MAG: SRPBCC domain-containing protein [Crocinitomicaceae bacterium]